MYIYIPNFWWNYIHSLFFFWYILLWIPACLELVFLFLKKEFTLSVFSFFSFKESIDFGTSRKNNTVEKQPESLQSGFWWEKPCMSPVVTKYTIKWESDGRKVSIGKRKNGYQFPRLSQFDGFHCIFPCICISHIIKYTIECESNGRKHPYYGKSMSTNLSGSPHTVGFVSGNQFPKL